MLHIPKFSFSRKIRFSAESTPRCGALHVRAALERLHFFKVKKTLIKEPPGNAQLFRLARRDLFLKQEWTLPSSTVSKKGKQRRQTE
jgi:hypothetical protein